MACSFIHCEWHHLSQTFGPRRKTDLGPGTDLPYRCILLGVMMVYKYWDSITGDDLEFSVGSKAGMWEIKDEPPAAYGVNKYVDSPSMSAAPSPNGGTRTSLFPEQQDVRTHSLIGGVSGQNAYVGSGYVGGGVDRSR